MVTNEISFEAWKNNYLIVYARKGEIDARKIVASFKGADGNNLDLTNKSVTFYALKPDKTQIYNNCNVDSSGNTASITLTSQTTSASGIVNCEFQIFEGDELLLKVGGLKLVVEDGGDFSEALESTSEYNALIEAITDAESFSESIGNLSDLSTSEKNTIVGAINEVNNKIIPISQGGTGATTATDARTNLGVMTETVLYSNESGTYSTITLSDDYSNYNYIEVIFNDNGVNNNVKLHTSKGQVQLTNTYVSSTSNPSMLYIHTALLTFSGNAATFSRQAIFTIWTNTNNPSIDRTTSNNIKVTRIVGYGY